MRRAAKVDANHGPIVDALRAAGATVQSLGAVGSGCPDLLVGYRGRNILMEVKDPRREPSKQRLRPAQSAWHVTWRGQVAVVKTIDEALELIHALSLPGAQRAR